MLTEYHRMILVRAILAPIVVVANLTAIVDAQESDEPPRILKGGLVQQLRSLTQDAMDSLDGSRGNAPSKSRAARNGKPSRPTRSSGRSGGLLSGLLPSSSVNSPASIAGDEAPDIGPIADDIIPPTTPTRVTEPSRTVPSSGLADVITPAELLGENSRPSITAPSSGLRPARDESSAGMTSSSGDDDIHVEQRLPENVRRSLGISGSEEPANRYQSKSDDEGSNQPAQAADQTTENVNAPPKVSRVPLPSRNRAAASSNATASKPATTTRSNSAPQVATRAVPKATVPKAQPTASSPSVSVSVPKTPATIGGSVKIGDTDGSDVPAQLVTVPVPMSQSAAKELAERRTALPAVPSLRPNSTTGLPTPAAPSASAVANNSGPASSGSGSLPKTTEMPSVGMNPRSVPPRTSTTSNDNALPSLPQTPSLPSSSLPSLPSDSSAPKLPAPSSLAQQPQITRNPTTPAMPRSTAVTKTPTNPTRSSGSERMRLTTPRIAVTLVGPEDMPVGVPANYQVVVTNDDQIDLRGLLLRLEVPKGIAVASSKPTQGMLNQERTRDGASLLTWSFEGLAAGKQAIAPLNLVASTARNFAIGMEWTLVPVDGTAQVAVLAPKLELALEGPSEVLFGKANTYRLRLRNAGDAPATDVAIKLTAEPYGASTTQIGSIGPGQEEVVDIELTFNQKGAINISALATAAGNLNSNSAIEVLVRKSEIVSGLQAPSLVYFGSPSVYRVVLSNQGDADAENVRASLQLPAGAQPTSLPAQATFDGKSIHFMVNRINAGEQSLHEFPVQLLTEGQNIAALQCTDSSGNLTAAQAETTVEAVVDLKLLVSDPIAPAPVGPEVVYELALTNRGSKAASNVKVIAQFSDGIEPTHGEGHGFRTVPGQVFFDAIETIPAGATVNLKVFAKAEASGMHRFRAEVRTDDSEMRLIQEESTQYLNTGGGRIAAPPSRAVIR